MDLFLMCCLFLFSGTPQGTSMQSLAAANAWDRAVTQALEVFSEACGQTQSGEAAGLTDLLLERERLLADPVRVQLHPETDTTALEGLWQQKQLEENRRIFRQRAAPALEAAEQRISMRQLEMENRMTVEYLQPVYDSEPVPEAMLRGMADLPDFAGGALEEGEWAQVVCPAFDAAGIQAADAFIHPIPGSWVSAGTWAYPQGGLHLGLDLAADLYTQVLAPASGLVLYQSADQPADSGYPGNRSGYPGGAGNSLLLLCPVGDRLFSVAFYHLSDIHYVRAGQTVRQGDVIALSGNAGNSTGPHTHVEICELGMDFVQAAEYFSQTADFSFGTGWSQPAACSDIACRKRPEELLPAQ